MESQNISPKSRAVALALNATLGWAGAHRFYVGKIPTGILMLLTGGGLGIWWLVDFIMVVSGGFRDIDHRRVFRWAEADSMSEAAGLPPRMDQVVDELYNMRTEMSELAERVDFMERMLEHTRRDRQVAPRAGGGSED